MRRSLRATVVALGVLIACDEPVEPPTTGRMAIRVVVPEVEVPPPTGAPVEGDAPANRVDQSRPQEAAGQDERVGGQVTGVVAQVQPNFNVLGHLTHGRVKISGPTPVDDGPFTLPAGGISKTYEDLAAGGGYTVELFGLVNDSVDYYARTEGVTVPAGGTATPTLTFQSFRPTLSVGPTPTTGFKVTATIGTVPNATGYVVEWAKSSSFSGKTAAAAVGTSHPITVSDTGTYYTRVLAQATGVTTPRSSDVATFEIRTDITASGDSASTAPDPSTSLGRSGTGAFSGTLGALNIFPASDVDWFKIAACTLDTLRLETRAQRAPISSALNTVLRVYDSDGTTQIAANDNLHADTTDSRLLVAVPYQDTFRIQVSGTGGTTGEYQLVIDLREGPDNTGTACVPRADLSKSTVGVSSALIAAGATSTITLTARDAADNQIPFGGSTVTFSASGGTSTGSIGAVTDNNDGTYTATFTGETAGTATQISAAIDGSAVTTLPKPTITVNNGPAATVAYRVAPAGATAGDTLRPNIEVIVQDAYGNQVTGATGSVTLAIGTNPAGGTLFGTVTKTLVAGVATFSNLRVDKAGTGYTLVASSGSLVSSTSGGFDITPAEATRLSFVVQPAAGVAGTPLTAVMVAVQDALGNTATGNANSITLNLANNPASANLTGTVTRNAQSGVATFDDLTLDKEGSGFTFQATALLLTGATSNAFSVGLGGATRLVITAEPGNAVAGQSIALQVALKDGAGNTVTTATDSVSIAIGTGALDPSGGAATLGGVRKVEPVSGVATFANLSLDKAFAAYRLVVTAGTLTPDTTVAITITPAGAAQLAFSQQPSSAAVGENITPAPAVQILDQYGNLTTSTAAVNVAIGTNPAGGALFGNTTVLAAGGVATFDTLSIDNAGSGYTLTASSGSLTGVTSAAFNITSGNATKLGFTAQPGNTALGTVMPAFTVAVQDPLGNTIAGATDQVTLTLQANPTGANILSGAVVNAVDGVATFNAVTLDRVGTGYTFKAKATGLDSTISNPFNITVGAPAKLSFTVEPSNATAGGSIAPALKVAVQDVGGNLVTSATNSITLAILNDPSTGTATLGGTVAQPAVGGIATFANITVNKAFNGYTVRATATGLAPDTSAAFNIGAAAANKLAFVTQPTAVAAGDAINPAPQVAVRDAFDNLVPGASNAVSMAIGTNPSGGVLFGTTNAAASGGTATFNDLRLDKAGAGYTLSASATGLTGATSSGFNVTAGNTVSATLSTAIASPATNVVANDFDLSVITVTVRDVNGNPMSGQTVALAATGSNNTVTQPGAVTDGSGQASGTIASTTAETKTVTVTVNPAGTAVVLTQQPTVQFIADVNTISASLSTATANPADPDSVAADNFQQSAVTVVVRDANSNPVAGQAVELATDLSGVLAQPGATDATGTAVGYLRNDVAETNTLSVTVNPAGTPVVLNQQPMVKFWEPACGIPNAVNSTVVSDLANVAANGVDVATITVTVLDCGSTPVQGATVAVSASGTGNVITGPGAPTDVNGVTTATISSTGAGAKTLTVTVNPGSSQIVLQSQPTVTFDAGAATHVVFVTQPSSTGAGASI
ncbi:MAG TPA: invasin domain 3-containing protein, partial [Gemmatimonadales bacterium]